MDVAELKPMLAKLVRELPDGDGWVFEPKWDGFRCLAGRDGDEVDLRSRHGRPFARYFPEVVAALHGLGPERFVLDGELLVVRDGVFDFASLMGRLHPAASRVRDLAATTPAVFVAFDALAAGDDELLDAPFADRRAQLEELLAGARPPLFVTPATADRELAAEWLARFCGGGLDGVVAKHRDGAYQPNARAMLKVKHERTADCVVAGLRVNGNEVTGLMLGLYDDAGELQNIGVASGFAKARRAELTRELAPLVVETLEGHPWEHGFLAAGGAMGRLKGAAGRWVPGMTMDWVPVAAERVVEVAYTQVDGHRLRHPAKFRRWRPDREPASCRVEQLDAPPLPAAQVLSARRS
jgi:ATP-dependent DNA ligase